ncbi:MAG TPA: Fe-S cluster assembly protein SufD [bacterium]|nr:Fe-S cluster assembly protein SufD [bacterium]HOL94033.1 Fe-S cluster assembly protein SufD [bacterium]
MTIALHIKDHYRSAFAELETTVAGQEPAWLHEIRKEALARFEALGFPSHREEAWRFTNTAPLREKTFHLAEADGRDTLGPAVRPPVTGLDAYQIVFVNGHFTPELSILNGLPQGTRVESIAAVLRSDPGSLEPYLARQGSYEDFVFAALNTAFMRDGAFVRIPAGAVLEKPIHLLYYSTRLETPVVSHPRNVIVAGSGSRAVILESYAGPDNAVYFTNGVTEVSAGEESDIAHCKLQREGHEAFHVSFSRLDLSRSSRYAHHSITLGGGLVRNELNALMNGEGIHCTLNGLYLVDGKRHVDNHTLMVHAKPHCESHEVYKGILDEQGRAVFRGRILVAKDAQKTDSKQTNQALLLSGEAEITAMPQLEIYADDVKCTHGATTGKLDDEALFYLRARGINLEDARELLTYAFASGIVEQIPVEAVRAELDHVLHKRLSFSHSNEVSV